MIRRFYMSKEVVYIASAAPMGGGEGPPMSKRVPTV
jgi:hypothetical protein